MMALPSVGQGSGSGSGAAPSVATRSTASATAGEATPTLKFDVVSVGLTKVARDGTTIESPPDGDGLTVGNATVEALIEYAYNFHRPELISGLPDWATTQTYDLTAKVADAGVAAFRKLDQGQRRLMLQAVLADRFGLKVRREPKEVPIYALVVAKGGVKMKEATPGDKYADGSTYQDGRPAGPGTLVPTPMGVKGQAVQMGVLVQMLSRLGFGREVVDQTGLTGRYDFTLHAAPTEAMRPVINGQMQPLSDEDAALPSIFTAVQEQLGLKLESTKGQVEGLAVEHVERLVGD
jgi:uncharacterized protein (TIGR03435 family)